MHFGTHVRPKAKLESHFIPLGGTKTNETDRQSVTCQMTTAARGSLERFRLPQQHLNHNNPAYLCRRAKAVALIWAPRRGNKRALKNKKKAATLRIMHLLPQIDTTVPCRAAIHHTFKVKTIFRWPAVSQYTS